MATDDICRQCSINVLSEMYAVTPSNTDMDRTVAAAEARSSQKTAYEMGKKYNNLCNSPPKILVILKFLINICCFTKCKFTVLQKVLHQCSINNLVRTQRIFRILSPPSRLSEKYVVKLPLKNKDPTTLNMLRCRVVKRSSNLRTLNFRFEFVFVFQPFDIPIQASLIRRRQFCLESGVLLLQRCTVWWFLCSLPAVNSSHACWCRLLKWQILVAQTQSRHQSTAIERDTAGLTSWLIALLIDCFPVWR